MKSSKYILVDTNILLEYIHDDGKLISEGYNVLYSTITKLRSFVSKTDSTTNNDLNNTIYKIDSTFDKYGSIVLDPLSPDRISDTTSSLQSKNFAPSIPIRYDEIKVHIPVNWTFGDYKGFYIRVWTNNFNDSSQVELSNYYFDITDVEMANKMEYSSNVTFHYQNQWGKYLKIQFPSITKVSDQRRDGVTRPNSINFNLTDGLGLSKTSPVFIDFHFINRIEVVNSRKFFYLEPRITTSVPQTPDFENIGVTVRESSQGDYYEIFGTYNSSLGELVVFLNESYYTGNRYYLEYTVDLYEKNQKIKSQTFLVSEEFNQIIEYRPIIKFSTTTAMIMVTMKIIDNTNKSSIVRRSSIGIIQEDVSKYSRSLSKINLKKALTKDIFNIKNTIQPNTGNDPFGTKPILILDRLPFTVYSSNFDVFTGSENANFLRKIWYGLNKTTVIVYPFDNIIKFNIIESSSGKYQNFDLSVLKDIKLVVKSDKKTLDFSVYRDSDQNVFEDGEIVFKIPFSKYNEVRELNLSGNDIFYIIGVDSAENKIIVYSGVILPFDSERNVNKLESDWISAQRRPDPPRLNPISTENKIKEQVSKIEKDKIKPKSSLKRKSLLFKNTFDNLTKLTNSSISRISQNSALSLNSVPVAAPFVEVEVDNFQSDGNSTWFIKRKSLATLRDGNFSWIQGPVAAYDAYVKKDNTGTKVLPTERTIGDYLTVRAKSESEAKQLALNTVPGLTNARWRKDAWPHFENVIYSTTQNEQLISFNSRLAGGGVGICAVIEDDGRVYYAEKLEEN